MVAASAYTESANGRAAKRGSSKENHADMDIDPEEEAVTLRCRI